MHRLTLILAFFLLTFPLLANATDEVSNIHLKYISKDSYWNKSTEIPFKTIPASEILGKIQNGTPVEYGRVIIKGDLNLKLLDLPKTHSWWTLDELFNIYKERGIIGILSEPVVVSSPIIIEDSIIDGNVYFNSTTFSESLDFGTTLLNGSAYFYNSNFKKSVIFRFVKFNGPGYFQISNFENGASFSGDSFNGSVDFVGSKFNEPVHFIVSEFNRSADFNSSIFNGTSFMGTKFNGPVYFSGSRFNKLADFSGSRFNKLVDFSGSEFNIPANFEGATFLESLNLTKASFDRIIIYWPTINNLICNDGPTCLAIIKNFRELEQFGAADDVYYQYRYQSQMRKSWDDKSKYIDFLALITCGYGVRWHFTIILALLMIFGFGSYFSCKIEIVKKSQSFGNFPDFWKSIFLSLLILISAPTDWSLYYLGEESYKDYISSNKYSIILERIIGWGLLLLFINTLSRVMIRY